MKKREIMKEMDSYYTMERIWLDGKMCCLIYAR